MIIPENYCRISKKITILILAVLMIIAQTGCSGGSGNGSGAASDPVTGENYYLDTVCTIAIYEIMNENGDPVPAADAREKAEAMTLAQKLREMTLVVTAKGGGAGRLFGSVTNQEIADALKAKTGVTIDKRKIVIADPIKNVGTYTVTCKLGYEITAPLTVKIEEGK
jgi:ribosomal protein L9